MQPKNIRLGAGEMYINTPDGFVPLGGVQEVEFTEEAELDILGDKPRTIVPKTSEFTATVTLAVEAIEALRKYCEIAEEVVKTFMRVWESIKALPLPNRRIIHLATRHGDPLVRKKNHKRAARYYKKIIKRGGQR